MSKDIKILTADDSAFMRKLLIDILKGAGYEKIIEAENGRVAVEKYNKEKPDLVLLDIIMPELDGVQVLKQIGPSAKVLMVSAVGQDSIIKDAMDSGAKGFIVKPFEKEKVLEEVKKALA